MCPLKVTHMITERDSCSCFGQEAKTKHNKKKIPILTDIARPITSNIPPQSAMQQLQGLSYFSYRTNIFLSPLVNFPLWAELSFYKVLFLKLGYFILYFGWHTLKTILICSYTNSYYWVKKTHIFVCNSVTRAQFPYILPKMSPLVDCPLQWILLYTTPPSLKSQEHFKQLFSCPHVSPLTPSRPSRCL